MAAAASSFREKGLVRVTGGMRFYILCVLFAVVALGDAETEVENDTDIGP